MAKWWDEDCLRNDIWNDDSYNNGYARTLCHPNEIFYVIYIYKICWSFYLIYLAVKSIKSAFLKRRYASFIERHSKDIGTIKSFRQGFTTAILNPKTAVFFLSFLPQFIVSNQNHFFQFLLLGLTFTTLTGIWYLLYISLIRQLRIFKKRTSEPYNGGYYRHSIVSIWS